MSVSIKLDSKKIPTFTCAIGVVGVGSGCKVRVDGVGWS